MRILFVLRYPFASFGGVQSTTHWLALELARRGHAAGVLVLAGSAESQGLRVEHSRGYPVFNAPHAGAALGPVADAFGAEAIIVAGYGEEHSGWARSVLAQASPRTTLLYVHNVGGAHLAAMQGPTLGGVAAPSDFVAAEIGSLGGEAVTVPPIVARANYHVPTSRRVVLFVNPIPQKGLDTALGLARARPDVRFVFVHSWAIDRAARREVNAEARRLRNVELRRGSTEPTEVYRDARLLLMPSAYPEAWGRVASEAQASGIPVIASAAAGLPEAVGDGGLLVDSRDGFDAWLRALSLLWDDSTAYAHFAARAELHSRRPDITAEAVGDRFEALLRRAAEHPSHRRGTRGDPTSSVSVRL